MCIIYLLYICVLIKITLLYHKYSLNIIVLYSNRLLYIYININVIYVCIIINRIY